MTSSRPHLATLPPVTRYAVVGATVCAILGGLVGLVVGLRVNPATAWFAVLEVGVPAGIVAQSSVPSSACLPSRCNGSTTIDRAKSDSPAAGACQTKLEDGRMTSGTGPAANRRPPGYT